MGEVTQAIQGLSEPITKLIETVSTGFGKVYEPFHVVRMAKAEAKAELVTYEMKQEIARRTATRVIETEIRRQENLEAIVDEAKTHLPAVVSAAPVDPDWTAAFFDNAKDVSDTHLRGIWARILASEVAIPGGRSRRTLGRLKELSKHEAEQFLRVRPLFLTDHPRSGFIEVCIPACFMGGHSSGVRSTDLACVSYGHRLTLLDSGLLQPVEDAVIQLESPLTFSNGGIAYRLSTLPGRTVASTLPVYPLSTFGCELAVTLASDAAFSDAEKKAFAEMCRARAIVVEETTVSLAACT